MYRLIACLLLLLLVVVALSGCGGDRSGEVRLGNLVERQTLFHDKRISTEGVVRRIEDPRHYWIEDEALNRVGVEPDAMVAELLGERVRVWGRFRYSEDSGRHITLERVERIAPPQ